MNSLVHDRVLPLDSTRRTETLQEMLYLTHARMVPDTWRFGFSYPPRRIRLPSSHRRGANVLKHGPLTS